jgi:hypothetical protein
LLSGFDEVRNGDEGPRLGDGGSVDDGELGSCELLASEMTSRESMYVGGLVSIKEIEIHHDPNGGSPGYCCWGATKNDNCHSRPVGLTG